MPTETSDEPAPFERCGGAYRLSLEEEAKPAIRVAMIRWNVLARRDGYFHEDATSACEVINLPLDPKFVSYHDDGVIVLDLARIATDEWATVENAMMHELGHAIGLPHLKPGNVMAETADGWPEDFGREDRAYCAAVGFCL